MNKPDNTTSYHSVNHPSNIEVIVCYICNKLLDGKLTNDHIIPDNLFPKGAEHRPVLPVHHICNNGKSLQDERFKYRIQLMASMNPVARMELERGLFRKANEESDNDFIIGKSNQVRHLRLLKTLSKDYQKQLELQVEGNNILQIKVSKRHMREINSYAKNITRGLFIRNVPEARPGRPNLLIVDKQVMVLSGKGKIASVMEAIFTLINDSKHSETFFAQTWKKHIAYVGGYIPENSSAGFVAIEFYDSYLIFATFGIPDEDLESKSLK